MKALVLAIALAIAFSMVMATGTSNASAGFDIYGYNDVAGIFNGPADGVDRNLDGTVWGDPTYANDKVVMKWSKGWQEGKETGVWTTAAWEMNEWNGNVEGGSGEVWHYKIIWIGPEGESSPYFVDGGYVIWGQFEVIMDQGTFPGGEHEWFAHASPCGYGQNP